MPDFSALAAGSAMDLLIAEVQGTVKVTRLPARRARKSELVMSRVGGGSSRFYAATGAGRNGREQNQRQRLMKVAAH